MLPTPQVMELQPAEEKKGEMGARFAFASPEYLNPRCLRFQLRAGLLQARYHLLARIRSGVLGLFDDSYRGRFVSVHAMIGVVIRASVVPSSEIPANTPRARE